MTIKMNSKRYDNGALWVACSDCNRGGLGAAKNKCSSGGFITEWNKLGCFLGELSPEQLAQLKGPILKWVGIQDDDVHNWHKENDKIADDSEKGW